MRVTTLLWLNAVTNEHSQFSASWENNERNEKTNGNSQVLWPRDRTLTSFAHIQSWTTWIQFSPFHQQQINQMFPILNCAFVFSRKQNHYHDDLLAKFSPHLQNILPEGHLLRILCPFEHQWAKGILKSWNGGWDSGKILYMLLKSGGMMTVTVFLCISQQKDHMLSEL